MKAIIYTRVNQSDEQNAIGAIALQENVNRKYCIWYGLQDIKSYSDICNENEQYCPGFEQMMKELANADISPNFLICLDPTRLSQNFKVHLRLCLELKRMGIRVRFANENIHDDPFLMIYDKTIDDMIAGIRCRFSRNTVQGMIKLIKQKKRSTYNKHHRKVRFHY